MKQAVKKLALHQKIGLGILVLMGLVVLVGIWYTPYPPNAMDPSAKWQAPSLAHWFGTDNFGRDIFSRVMRGLRDTFFIATGIVLIGAVTGSLVGAVTGYFGGTVDEIMMRVNDTLTAFPSVLLALVFISILGGGKYHVILALGIAFIPSFTRLIRGEVMKYRHADFASSARLCGCSHLRIIFVHIFPNCVPTLLNGMAIGFNNAVLAESGLSYLGIGVTPPDASLGLMLSEAQGYMLMAPWYALAPGLTVVVLILGFAQLADKR